MLRAKQVQSVKLITCNRTLHFREIEKISSKNEAYKSIK